MFTEQRSVASEKSEELLMPAFALFGASGQTGGPIPKALSGAGMQYRVVGRNRQALETEFGSDPLAEVVTWNPGVVHDVFVAAVQGRRANLIGPIDTPHQFVYVPDIGPLSLALAQEPRAYGQPWQFAGSGTITQREFARRVFEKAGRDPKFMVANKAMLRMLGFFNPLMRELVEMHYLQTNPVIMDDSGLRALLPEIHATGYDDGIAQTLSTMQASIVS